MSSRTKYCPDIKMLITPSFPLHVREHQMTTYYDFTYSLEFNFQYVWKTHINPNRDVKTLDPKFARLLEFI